MKNGLDAAENPETITTVLLLLKTYIESQEKYDIMQGRDVKRKMRFLRQLPVNVFSWLFSDIIKGVEYSDYMLPVNLSVQFMCFRLQKLYCRKFVVVTTPMSYLSIPTNVNRGPTYSLYYPPESNDKSFSMHIQSFLDGE